MVMDGQWQNSTRAGERYVNRRFHTERKLVGYSSHEDFDDLPERWLAIMHAANHGKTVPRRMRPKKRKRTRK